MLTDYLPIAVLLAISGGLALIAVVLGHSFGPRRPTRPKGEPYESGMRTLGPAVRRLPVRFYLIAVLFILFDIEVIFFLPWAVVFRELGAFAFAQMLVFVGILLVGYVWVWKKGALEWE
ncbi:MAG: NADH-quinone oxidoreductase subunit A [Anaerolineales bacterium]